jgi:hypothetical protein
MHDLFDVMNHTVQQPLDIYFDFSPEGKTVQALLSPDIGKNRLGYGEPLWVNLSSFSTRSQVALGNETCRAINRDQAIS